MSRFRFTLGSFGNLPLPCEATVRDFPQVPGAAQSMICQAESLCGESRPRASGHRGGLR